MYEYTLAQHIEAVKNFMVGAKQTTRNEVSDPSSEELILRAKLIFEEALETINALGVSLYIEIGSNSITFRHDHEYDPLGVLDGICDTYVVNTGTLHTCGLSEVFQEALSRVDSNNLSKINGNHSFREDGKLLKPPEYVPVVLSDLVAPKDKSEI